VSYIVLLIDIDNFKGQQQQLNSWTMLIYYIFW